MAARITETPSVTRAVAPNETVHAIVERYPETRAVLEAFGIHACCGGDAPLAAAAERDGVSLEGLLAELRAAARPR